MHVHTSTKCALYILFLTTLDLGPLTSGIYKIINNSLKVGEVGEASVSPGALGSFHGGIKFQESSGSMVPKLQMFPRIPLSQRAGEAWEFACVAQ